MVGCLIVKTTAASPTLSWEHNSFLPCIATSQSEFLQLAQLPHLSAFCSFNTQKALGVQIEPRACYVDISSMFYPSEVHNRLNAAQPPFWTTTHQHLHHLHHGPALHLQLCPLVLHKTWGQWSQQYNDSSGKVAQVHPAVLNNPCTWVESTLLVGRLLEARECCLAPVQAITY